MRDRATLLSDFGPFAPAVIETLPGRGGGPPLSYVSWTHYAQRLLLAHGPHRYSVTSIVAGADGGFAVSVRVQFDDDEWYDGVGHDTDADKAESQAYKRACAHAGIGLHLYGSYWLLTQMEAGG